LAVPRILIEPREAEPLSIGSQDIPGNQLIDFLLVYSLPGSAW
jgi:hypothetical protein